MPRPVHLTVQGSVALLTLNVPERRNALSPSLVTALAEAMDAAEANAAVRSVVIVGAGRAFCAGAELETLRAAADGDFPRVRAVYDGFLRVLHSPLVTIAAVNGPAVGAGMNLALACDIRLAGASARFDTRFAQLRIHPGGGHAWLLARAVGQQNATLACLFGQEWDAEAARHVGLVADVRPDDTLVADAVALGRRLDEQDAEYTRQLTHTLRQALLEADHAIALEQEAAAQQASTLLPAFAEGLARIEAHVASRSTS
jgi:enoyl-CoA hydratase